MYIESFPGIFTLFYSLQVLGVHVKMSAAGLEEHSIEKCGVRVTEDTLYIILIVDRYTNLQNLKLVIKTAMQRVLFWTRTTVNVTLGHKQLTLCGLYLPGALANSPPGVKCVGNIMEFKHEKLSVNVETAILKLRSTYVKYMNENQTGLNHVSCYVSKIV